MHYENHRISAILILESKYISLLSIEIISKNLEIKKTRNLLKHYAPFSQRPKTKIPGQREESPKNKFPHYPRKSNAPEEQSYA